MPSLTKWTRHPGGPTAAPGKSRYVYDDGGTEYSIDAFTYRDGRHRGYACNVYPGKNQRQAGIAPGGHEIPLGEHLFRSPQAAAKAATRHMDAARSKTRRDAAERVLYYRPMTRQGRRGVGLFSDRACTKNVGWYATMASARRFAAPPLPYTLVRGAARRTTRRR